MKQGSNKIRTSPIPPLQPQQPLSYAFDVRRFLVINLGLLWLTPSSSGDPLLPGHAGPIGTRSVDQDLENLQLSCSKLKATRLYRHDPTRMVLDIMFLLFKTNCRNTGLPLFSGAIGKPLPQSWMLSRGDSNIPGRGEIKLHMIF